ncbi:MAG: phage antirepressor N-terminal domain-containing protein [Pseudomonadota bacterium]
MGNIVTVNFRNDTLFAVERDDGVFVALRPIVQALGLDWKSQHRRVSEDAVLREGVVTMTMPSPGGCQETTCLRLDLVNGWLFTIDESRVKDEETRQRVLAYKRECYAVLFQHFHGKHQKPAPVIEEDPAENESVKIRLVNESRQVFGTQAAAQLWFRLGLPVVPAMLHDPRQINLLDYAAIKTAEAA